MSIDGSGANRAYQPDPGDHDAEAQAALERDHRDWTGAGHMPPAWIVALADIDPLAPHGIDISGTWVAFTVASATDDPAVMCTALHKLTRVVADTEAAQPDVPVIDRRLPQQIGSARWHTPSGDVTVIQPGQARHRKPPRRRRFAALGAPIAAVWALVHGRIPLAPLGAAAGIAAVAMVPVIPTPPPAAPAQPVPGHIREAFVPARTLPAATVGPKARPSQPPRRTHMSAPVQTTEPTEPADSPRKSPALITLPTVTVALPGSSSTTSTTTATPKVSVPPLPKVVKRIVRRTCVTVYLPLLRKQVTTCKKA